MNIETASFEDFFFSYLRACEGFLGGYADVHISLLLSFHALFPHWHV